MIVTESLCEVKLKDLFDHTVKRLFIFLNLSFEENHNPVLTFEAKYGFDGTNVERYLKSFIIYV